MTGQPHISVCICTFQRAELLKRLLGELARQTTGGQFTFSVVIADNDQAQSARAIVTEAQSVLKVEVNYCVEGRQNIALARNKALENASGDYIAFIDDDEFPAQNWLQNLFQALKRFKVDGVLGPVKPYFEQQPPEWVIRGAFFERPTHETGFTIPPSEGRTGNLLFRREILEGIGEPFRAEFGSGGEDRDFFLRLMDKGRAFVWCNEAVAYEVVPPGRWRRSFMLKRALLRGKMSLNQKACGLRGVVTSLVAVPLYLLALPFLLLRGQHAFMRYMIKLCDHAGRVLASVGMNPIKAVYLTE